MPAVDKGFNHAVALTHIVGVGIGCGLNRLAFCGVKGLFREHDGIVFAEIFLYIIGQYR